MIFLFVFYLCWLHYMYMYKCINVYSGNYCVFNYRQYSQYIKLANVRTDWIQLDLILILINVSCELGQLMNKYDFLEARKVILSNV